MKIGKSSIYINLKKLRKLLYQAQFLMNKADRVIYGTPLMQNCGDVLKYFLLAYTIESKREEYLEISMGFFYVLKTDLEFCNEENLIHFKRRKPKIPNPSPEDYVSSKKIELFEIIAKIDTDMCRFRQSLRAR